MSAKQVAKNIERARLLRESRGVVVELISSLSQSVDFDADEPGENPHADAAREAIEAGRRYLQTLNGSEES